MEASKAILQKIGLGTITAIISILTIINLSSGIIGGIWLTFSGGIGLVIMGAIYGIVMPWLYTLAFLPTILLMTPLSKALESKQITTVGVLAFILNVYQTSILTFWVLYVFGTFISYWKEYPVLALLLCGYSTMMAPLGYMASKEGPDSIGTTFSLLVAQILYIIITFMWLFNFSGRIEILGFCVITYSLLIAYITTQLALETSQNTEYNLNYKSTQSQKIQEAEVIINSEKDSDMQMQYCNKCGNKITNLTTFCTKCGKKLK